MGKIATSSLQLRLLLWKNFTLRKRRPVFLVLEILAPVVVIVFLTTLRLRDLVVGYPPCHFQPKPLPSAGTIPWLTAHICNLNNSCFEQETGYQLSNQLPDVTPVFNSIARLFKEFDRLDDVFGSIFQREKAATYIYKNTTFRTALSVKLGNPDLLRGNLTANNLTLSDTAWDEFLNLTLNYTNSINKLSTLSSQQRCDPDQIKSNFIINDLDRIKSLRFYFCNFTEEELITFRQVIASNFNKFDYYQSTVDESGNSPFSDEVESFGNLFLDVLESFTIFFEDIQGLIPENDGNENSNDQIRDFSRILCGENSDFVKSLNNVNTTESDNESRRKKRKKRSTGEFQSKKQNILNRKKRAALNKDQKFCKELIGLLNSKQFQFIYDYTGLNLFLEGAIYYTPVNDLTREIVKYANKTFGGIGKLGDAITEWNERFSPTLYEELANGDLTEFLRDLTDSCRSNDGTDDGVCGLLNDWLNTSNTNTDNWVVSISFVDEIMNEIGNYLGCFNWNKFVPTESEDAFNDINNNNNLWAGVVFDGLPNNTVGKNITLNDIKHMSVRIRMGTKYVDATRAFKVFDSFWSTAPRRQPLFDMKYFNYGFIYLQDIIVNGIMTVLNGGKELNYGILMQQFPYPCYSVDTYNLIVARSLPLFMTIGWIFAVSLSVRAIVYEKELRLKEVMRVMGLSNGIHWCGWLITTLTLMTSSAIIITIFLKYGRILPESDVSLIFFVMITFVISTVAQAFFISVFFSKANIAATVSGIVYLVTYLPFNIVEFQEDALSEPVLYCLCLLSPVAFGLSTQYLARYESTGKGMQWSNISESTAVEDPFNMAKCLGMMYLDAFIFAILTWYIEGVFPGKYGVPRKWYFPFTRDYWCGKSKNVEDKTFGWDNYETDRKNFEDEPVGLNLGVAIRQLCKVYKNSKRAALDHLSLNFYENQITSFLGHNGAGKTTAISILTGLYTPSSGTAYIYGKDIKKEMDDIRHNLGLCPQFNVLFDFLTVEEHIYFYGLLKGMSEDDIEREITTFLKDVGLPQKRKELSKNLSGGMKRKLSVAMAFVGGSKVVILDEPTAGVDPYARRSIWDLLVRCRENRTIILTTHHMDEADVLGDRIAIISKGKLKCCGSSIFLKNLYGTGYHLILVKDEKITNQNGNQGDYDVKGFIQRRIPNAELVEETDTEWIFKLPLGGISDGSYQSLFIDLDEAQSNLNISSYGLSDTSLEEVFLTVADDPADEINELSENNSDRNPENGAFETISDDGIHPTPVTQSSLRRSLSINSRKICRNKTEKVKNEFYCPDQLPHEYEEGDGRICNGAGTYKVTGFIFIFVQFQALWIKRFHNFRRNKRGFIAELIFPTLFLILACAAISFSTNFSSYPPMEVHPWLMKFKRFENMNIFYSNSNVTDRWTATLANSTRTPLGAGGVRCMNSSIYALDGYPCSTKYANETWSSGPNGTIPQRTPDCICIKGRPQECNDSRSGGPEPPKKILDTTDILHDLTGYNISDYLLKTHNVQEKNRFGGFKFTKLSRESLSLLTDRQIKNFFDNQNYSNLPVKINEFARSLLEPDSIVTVYFNNKGYASSVAYLAVAQNLIMRSLVYKNEKEGFNRGISVINHPLNLTYKNLLEDAFSKTTISLVLAIFIIFAMSFIPASFVLFLIDERVTYSKHLQFVSGLSPYIYWIANYVWDIMNYLLAVTLITLIFVAFQFNEFISREFVGPYLLLMVGYGVAVIPFLYPASFLFKTSSTAFVLVSSINFLLGLGTTLSVYIIQTLIDDDVVLEKAFDVLSIAFLIFPQYCLGRGLIDLSRLYLGKQLEIDFFSESATALDFPIIGKNLVAMACQAVVYFLLVIFIERKFFAGDGQCCKKEINLPDINDEDEDVAAERMRVLSNGADEDSVRLVNLTKVYSTKRLNRPAVNQLCLGIKKGQCFGLLGVNGAGKTSTFKMLTGQEFVTSGDAFVASRSVRSELIRVHRNIGYCPQFDALNYLLTGRETLFLYARLRGVPHREIDWVVNWALNRLSLMPHADKTAGAYSGGNKRKLSTAIALIGNPDVIFLDEPTSGMDPGAKRFLWNCILEIVQEGRCVVLTTHSMEECEALCQRLCIMVNGNIKCLGSVQHLKSRFGEGYTVALKLKKSNINTDAVIEFMSNNFPESSLNEVNYTLIEYKVTNDTKLAKLFKCLQEGKVMHGLYEEYSVSQTTLDQVFIDFAKYQSDLYNEEIEDAKCSETCETGSVKPDNIVVYDTNFTSPIQNGKREDGSVSPKKNSQTSSDLHGYYDIHTNLESESSKDDRQSRHSKADTSSGVGSSTEETNESQILEVTRF